MLTVFTLKYYDWILGCCQTFIQLKFYGFLFRFFASLWFLVFFIHQFPIFFVEFYKKICYKFEKFIIKQIYQTQKIIQLRQTQQQMSENTESSLLKTKHVYSSNPQKQFREQKYQKKENQSVGVGGGIIGGIVGGAQLSQTQKRGIVKLPSTLNINMNKRYSYNSSYNQSPNNPNQSVILNANQHQKNNRSQSPRELPQENSNSNDCQIYFNKEKKSSYMKNIVDKYFDLSYLAGSKNAVKIPKIQTDSKYSKDISSIKFKRPAALFKQKAEYKDRNNISLNLIQTDRGQNQGNKMLSHSANHFFKEGVTSQRQPIKNQIKGRKAKNQQFQQNSIQDQLQANPNHLNNLNHPSQLNQFNISYSHPMHFHSSFLPPIFQVNDIDDLNQPPVFQSTKLSSVVQLEQQAMSPTTVKETKMMVFQNTVYTLWLVFYKSSNIKGKPKYRLKEYKPQGIEILKREKRFFERYQIVNIWKQSKYNHFALMSSMIPPIKDLLFRVTSEVQGKSLLYKVTPKNYQKYLLGKNNIELHNFIRDMCSLLRKIQGKVSNNKINPNNIFLVDGKPTLAEWGQASFRQQWNIQENTFQRRVDPVLRSQTEWFATPEYLSPQILRQMVQEKSQEDIWQNPSSSDIWSLGLTIFQIVTCIPVWSPIKCVVKGKAKTGRPGIFGVQNRNLDKILQRQKRVQKTVKKCLLSQFQADQLSEKTVNLILRMLEYQPQKRITLEEILQILL